MNQANKEHEPKPPDKWNVYLIAAIVFLALFITVCIFLIILVKQPRQAAKPKQTVPHNSLPIIGIAASVYVRYLIDALICATVIYFLKIKSIFLQIVLFILGMLILNLIWVRIFYLFLS